MGYHKGTYRQYILIKDKAIILFTIIYERGRCFRLIRLSFDFGYRLYSSFVAQPSNENPGRASTHNPSLNTTSSQTWPVRRMTPCRKKCNQFELCPVQYSVLDEIYSGDIYSGEMKSNFAWDSILVYMKYIKIQFKLRLA